MSLSIREGERTDVPLIAELIRGLARYERLEDQVSMTEARLYATLFGSRRYAETLIAELDGEAVGFALFFHNYSTFLGQPGIYLEDLFVKPELRGRGIGKGLLAHLARLAKERGCGRVEWAVLDWNTPSIQFYRSIGAVPLSDWEIFRLTGDALDALART